MTGCNPAAFSDAPRSFCEHYYETADPMEVVAAPGYFDLAAHRLAAGDLIRVRAGLSGAIAYREFLVAHSDGRQVRVTDMSSAAPASSVARNVSKHRQGKR